MPAFDIYVVTHLSKHPTVDATITCISGGSAVGILRFIKDDVPLPANIPGSAPTVHFPISQFNDVITTLRYEKPLQFNLSPQGIATVGTGREPIGEEEGASP